MLSSSRKHVVVVPVRAGSKGLPGKNILNFANVPLFMRTVNQGIRTVGRVLLSTDIDSISQDSLPADCELCRRSPKLSADDTPMSSVISNIIATHELYDHTIVLLQATSPLRSDEDILRAISLYDEGRHDLVMTVVERDRDILKYGTLEEGNFIAMRSPAYCFQNRQNLPRVHGPNGAVYVFSANKYVSEGNFPNQNIGACEMPEERSIDIDTIEDFRRAESYLASH